MKFDKFQSIVEFNRKHQDAIAVKVKDFYFKMGMNYDKDLLNIMMIVRPLFNKKNYLVIEMPFEDDEIGAFCYKNDGYGYTILNSSLPKVNANFALAHEIFHVFYQEKMLNKKIELYMDEHYLECEEEMSANLFAGILLMPTPSFEEMYNKFQNEENSCTAVFCKLMSYYEVPFMAAVIRAYELGLLTDGRQLEELLATKSEIIEEEFGKLWLDESILKPTKRDDYFRLENLLKNFGAQCVQSELMDEETLEKLIQNIRGIYCKIRG